MYKIKIGIVDDDYLIVTLLNNFFDHENTIKVVFNSTDSREFLCYLEDEKSNELDILLLDLKMKPLDGLEILKHIKVNRPELKVIVISSHYQDCNIGFMTREGAASFLPKGISPYELLNIIRQVYDKGFYLTSAQVEILRNQISVKVPKPTIGESEEIFTDREIEIIKLLCRQKTAKEIGETLYIAQRTVEGHKNNLFSKIGVRNVAGLIVYALQKNIVTLEELSLA